MKQVVITADDAGICSETNAAIEAAARTGVLTSISVMTNMPAVEEAVAVAARHPALGAGVHLVLTSGRSVSLPDCIPLLARADGTFRYGFLGLWRLLVGRRGPAAVDQVRREMEAQVERALALGLRVDHLDSHRHVHMIPRIWPLAAALARELGCPFVRASAQSPVATRPARPMNVAKAVLLRQCANANARSAADPQSAASFAGVLEAGRMTTTALLAALRRAPDGVTEIVTHPSFASSTAPADAALCCSRDDMRFLRSPFRRQEAQALIADEVRRAIDHLGIELTSFRQLAARRPPVSGARVAC